MGRYCLLVSGVDVSLPPHQPWGHCLPISSRSSILTFTMTERLAPPVAEGPVSVGPEALTVGSEWSSGWARWLDFGVGWTPVFLPEGTSSSPLALFLSARPLTVALCVCTAPSLPPEGTES